MKLYCFCCYPLLDSYTKKKLSEEKKILQWKEDTRMPRELLNIG